MSEKRVYYYTYISPEFKENSDYLIKTLKVEHEWTEWEKKLFKKSFKEMILDKLRRLAMIFKKLN